MRLERIVRNLPANWTSCFCYPHCIAPWIDTMTFVIPGFSVDGISPNLATDSIPRMGIITIELYQLSYENNPDTITFTGTTVANGVSEIVRAFASKIFPNPFTSEVTVTNDSRDGFWLMITNLQGQVVCAPAAVYRESTILDLSFLASGVYCIEV